ncbi:hypothetical protein CVT25_004148 [Psilocybe cyanescens]|uniref:Uncharacterized protein n=1 Tax=Psilocybe cyanescens TaxID=93625 RepID=A0A409XKX6_PSICY|nr:hypothetical protein CVT25_004148 [Psilocybe cyanescens]
MHPPTKTHEHGTSVPRMSMNGRRLGLGQRHRYHRPDSPHPSQGLQAPPSLTMPTPPHSTSARSLSLSLSLFTPTMHILVPAFPRPRAMPASRPVPHHPRVSPDALNLTSHLPTLSEFLFSQFPCTAISRASIELS